MTMNKDEAGQALAQVEETQRQARAFKTYAAAGPIFAAWGVTWLCGNVAYHFELPHAGLITATLGMVSIGLSIGLGLASAPANAKAADHGKALLSGLVFAAAVLGLMMIVAPLDPRAANAVISFLVGATYAYAGIWMGARIGWLGGGVALVVLFAWFGARDYFELIVGAAGGGLLIVTGLWLWRQ